MDKHFLGGIDTVILRVSDINNPNCGRRKKLGFKSIHEDEKMKLVVLDTISPTTLTIWQSSEQIKINPRTCAYPIFRATDAGAARGKLSDSGVRVSELTTDHVVTYFTFEDPDGNLLEVCQVHN